MFFKDGTYRSYVLTASSTAQDVCDLIQQKFAAERLDDHCLFYVKGQTQRLLEMNELPVPLTEKFSSGNEKIMFKHRDDVVVPKREVVRVYFTDHTYKSFMVGPEDTVRSLIMQVAKKVQVAPHGHYLLEMTGDETKPLTDTDLVQDIKSEWEQGANTAFVFSKEIKPNMRKGWVEETEEQEQEKQRAATPASALPSFKPSFVLGGEAGLNMARLAKSSVMQSAMQASKVRREVSVAERNHMRAMQQHAYTHWVDYHLAKIQYFIEDMSKDMCDGVLLINLLQVLTGESIGICCDKPEMTIFEKMENVNKAMNWLRSKGMNMRGYGPEDILDGNVNVISAIIWSIISVSSVHPFDAQNTTETKAKQLLLQWCQQQVQGYPSVRIDNLDLSWQDGLGFCALLHKYRPDMIDYNAALNQGDDRIDYVMALLAENFGVTPILLPADLKKKDFKPDERSVFAFLTVLREVLTCALID